MQSATSVNQAQVKGQEQRPLAWPAHLGIVPNFSDWSPGDIVLLSATGSAGSAVVQSLQNAHPDRTVRAQSRWTHCAVYLGDGLIADSRPGRRAGVRRLAPECAQRELRLLRLKDSVATPDERRLFAEEVLALEDVPYMVSPVGYVLMHQGLYPTAGVRYGLVCSALIEQAAGQAGVALGMAPQVRSPLVPASLAVHPWLEVVPADWRLAV